MSRLWLVSLLVPFLLRLFKSRPLPSRESIISPTAERVVLLGASSGIGRDLAIAYARRGARICIVARRLDQLQKVQAECIGANGKVLVIPADITSPTDLLRVRDDVVQAWGGLDTLHILAGVPSTQTLLDIAGVSLQSGSFSSDTTSSGLEQVAAEARACSDVNYLGTILAVAAFLPTLARSRSPVLHHLSSVAATIPAPCRTIYSATKAAAFMAVESCRVECEGCGVRFFTLLPGTIANDFRTKHAIHAAGGRDETQLPIRHAWESLLLQPERVVSTILHHLSLNPAPAPLIPYFPFNLIPALNAPPKAVLHLPAMYYWATLMSWTPLGWAYVEKSARRKYGLQA